MIREGDIVDIPLPDGRTAVGWVLHLSRIFDGAVGFVVLGIKGELPPEAIVNPQGELPRVNALGPLYTHIEAAKHYGWTVLAHQPVSEEMRSMTRRLVGGGVYVADVYMGNAEDFKDSHLRPMLALGMPVVFQEIDKAFRS